MVQALDLSHAAAFSEKRGVRRTEKHSTGVGALLPGFSSAGFLRFGRYHHVSNHNAGGRNVLSKSTVRDVEFVSPGDDSQFPGRDASSLLPISLGISVLPRLQPRCHVLLGECHHSRCDEYLPTPGRNRPKQSQGQCHSTEKSWFLSLPSDHSPFKKTGWVNNDCEFWVSRYSHTSSEFQHRETTRLCEAVVDRRRRGMTW